jgi:glycosyltransferase involved in cell wall biosynthesis
MVDGVEFIRFNRVLDPEQIECDVFISSRDKNAIVLKPKARMKALWVHDIHCGDDPYSRMTKYDKILCLTEWHKQCVLTFYPYMDKKKITVTRNGIDPERFKPETSFMEIMKGKDWPPSFCYSSSPDRGLELLLRMWPEVREICSGGTLHVCYGFSTWKAMVKGKPVQEQRVAWFEERLDKLKNEGVIYHGRINQTELAQLQMKSALWLYPTDFKETSCITAMENQAAGAVPVTTALAALNETVGTARGVLVKPYSTEPRYKVDFLKEVKRLVEDGDTRYRLAQFGREHALANLTWDGVAAQWEQIFAEP